MEQSAPVLNSAHDVQNRGAFHLTKPQGLFRIMLADDSSHILCYCHKTHVSAWRCTKPQAFGYYLIY